MPTRPWPPKRKPIRNNMTIEKYTKVWEDELFAIVQLSSADAYAAALESEECYNELLERIKGNQFALVFKPFNTIEEVANSYIQLRMHAAMGSEAYTSISEEDDGIEDAVIVSATPATH